MKHILPLFLFFRSLGLNAQISIPFSTSFKVGTEQNQWTLYRTGQNKPVNYKWSFFNEELQHGYPVGGSTPTNDWMVSDEIDLTYATLLDSIRFKGAGFGTPMGADTIALYVLEGHPNPDSASAKTIVKLFTDSFYKNDNVWKTIRKIWIPPFSSKTYLAFRYQTTNNWLDVSIDDMYIKGANLMGFGSLDLKDFRVFPNPVKDVLNIASTNKKIFALSVYGMDGRLVKQKGGEIDKINVSNLASGQYMLSIQTEKGTESHLFLRE